MNPITSNARHSGTARNLTALEIFSGPYDRLLVGRDIGVQQTSAQFLPSPLAGDRGDAHGGAGYSKEFHVERCLREIMIPRIAPITPHMILNFIAEKVLGLPKSYEGVFGVACVTECGYSSNDTGRVHPPSF
jgi:hypothetical protein